MQTEKELEQAWYSFKEQGDRQAREALIIHYAPLVKIIASRLFVQYNQNVPFEDLRGCGVLGLIDAIEKFDISKNVKFETYASLRIKGAMIDELRECDWIPRSCRKKYSELQKAIEAVQTKYSGNYTEKQLAEYMNLSLEQLHSLLSEVHTYSLVSLEEKIENHVDFDIVDTKTTDVPESAYVKKEMHDNLHKAIDELPDKDKKIMYLYYFEELTYKEIAKILGLSESRISQIHTRIVAQLSTKLK